MFTEAIHPLFLPRLDDQSLGCDRAVLFILSNLINVRDYFYAEIKGRRRACTNKEA